MSDSKSLQESSRSARMEELVRSCRGLMHDTNLFGTDLISRLVVVLWADSMLPTDRDSVRALVLGPETD